MEENKFLSHLNTQTNSNLSFSLLNITQLVNWASEKKMEYLTIADYYPYSVIEFLSLCKEKKIKPIWGVKIFLVEEDKGKKNKYSVTVYPQNNKGYKEIMQKLFSFDSPSDRIFSFEYVFSNLSKNCLIILESKKVEDINYFANHWILSSSLNKEINRNNLFIGFNFFLFSPTQNLSTKIIPLLLPFFSIRSLTNDIEVLEQWKKITYFSKYFLSFDTQIQGKLLPYLDTKDYFSQVTDDLQFYQLLLIQWQVFLTKISLNSVFSKKKTNKAEKEKSLWTLKSKCLQKLLTLSKAEKDEYSQVLEKELKVIEKLNYTNYFLVFSDAVNYLREKEIVIGPGRGSAVSSLVSYLLGITSVDPLKHGLFFERFLNEKREVLPDIDLDIENQDELFNYLQQKYPKKQVARIITKKKIGWKLAFQEAVKLYKGRKLITDRIISLIGENPDLNNLRVRSYKNSYPSLFKLAEHLQNLYYDTSIHPAGIIIHENTLNGTVPLMTSKNSLLTLLEEHELSQLGLKKYDFLSLRETLGFIRKVKEITQGKLPDYQEINLNDEKTWKLLRNSLLTGIFQLDTSSARLLFNKFCPQNFSELIIFLALNRPGIRQRIEGIIQTKLLIRNRISYNLTVVEETLSESYGFIIFEEQFSQILSLIYNCSFEEAEIKRREISKIKKKLPDDLFDKIKEKITSPAESKIIYQQIESAIGYTFNKAHAVAYAYLTYYISYLKANFFPELITYLLNQKKEKTLPYLQESFFLGFEIKTSDINHSEMDWTRKNNELYMGYSSLKSSKMEFFKSVIEERKANGNYQNWEDFVERTINHWDNIEISDFEEWVKSGLFNSLQINSNDLLESKEALFRYLSIKKKTSLSKKDLPFLDLQIQKKNENLVISNQREYEALGLYISYFSRWKKITREFIDYNVHSLLDVFQITPTSPKSQEISINVYSVICQIENKDKSNFVLFLQDVRNSFKLNISNQTYQENKENIKTHNELLFTLKLKIEAKERKVISLTCEKIVNLWETLNN